MLIDRRRFSILLVPAFALAFSTAAFAQHVDEGAGGPGVALLDRLVDLPRSHLVPSDPFLAKAHPGSILVSV